VSGEGYCAVIAQGVDEAKATLLCNQFSYVA